MADAQAVLVDALDTMHAAGAAVQEKADDAGIDLLHGVAKQRRMLRYGEAFDAMLDVDEVTGLCTRAGSGQRPTECPNPLTGCMGADGPFPSKGEEHR